MLFGQAVPDSGRHRTYPPLSVLGRADPTAGLGCHHPRKSTATTGQQLTKFKDEMLISGTIITPKAT